MAVQQTSGRSTSAPADPHFTYWADGVDAPIRLARFPCCGRYVCRCDEDDEERDVPAIAARWEHWVNRQEEG